MINEDNPILDTDSYKPSHWLQYPPDASSMFSYFESRGGKYPAVTFFGLQYLLKKYLTVKITEQHVKEAAEFCEAHGEPFNEGGWMRIVNKFDGKLPVRIRAVPEGTKVPNHNILFSVESTDPDTFWIVSWLETQLVRIWYPSTVCTLSSHNRDVIMSFLKETADDPEAEIDFKMHDFGGRGVSCREQGKIGGAAHLANFKGSDTIVGVLAANKYYDCDMAGFSIPAAEHSSITGWGRENEVDAYRNFVEAFLYGKNPQNKKFPLAACVSDSYDIWNVIENVWCGELHDLVRNSGGTLVVRPDSGVPVEVVTKCLQTFDHKLGLKKNSKGYKVLPPYYRLIQGDGVEDDSILEILKAVKNNGFSTSNIAFGIGGALLQKLNRDTQKCAFKCSAMLRNNQWIDVSKDPIDDPGKRSKPGRLDLVKENGQYKTIQLPDDKIAADNSEMHTVFENGELMNLTTFDDVRERARLND